MRRGGVLIVVLAVLAVLAWLAWDAMRGPGGDGARAPDPTAASGDDAPAPARDAPARARARLGASEASVEAAPPDAAPSAATAHGAPQGWSLLVKRADGAPAAGASVRVLAAEADGPGPGAGEGDAKAPVAPVMTGADGRANLPGPRRLGRFAHVVGEDAQAALAELAPDAEGDVVVTLGAGVRISGRTVEGHPDGSLVEDEGDERGDDAPPIRGADLSLRWPAKPERWGAELVLSATSDETGAFAFPPLPPLTEGAWASVRADAPGHAHAVEYLGADEAAAGPVELRLAKAVRYSGRVLGPDGKPVRGADIDCEGADDVETGDDGRFVVEGVPAGTDRLTVDARVHAPLVVNGLPPAGGDLGDLVLAPGRTLRGLFVDADGSPVTSGTVWLRDRDHGGWSRQAEPGADGRFQIVGLPEGEFEIEASAHGPKFGEGRSVTVTGVRLGEGDVRIALPAGRRALFRLLLAADRSVVRTRKIGVDLERAPEGHGISARSWESSAADIDRIVFEFETAGSFGVRVSVPGYAPVDFENLEILDDRVTEVDVLLVEEAKR